MAIEIEEYYQDFSQNVYSYADAAGRFAEDSFFDIFCEYLIEAGEFESAIRVHYLGQRGVRVDGYSGDPDSSGGVLNLIIADYIQSQSIATLTATEIDSAFKRLHSFILKSLDSAFIHGLEETSAVFGLSELIFKRWKKITKIRLFLISNRGLSTRVDGKEAGEIKGIPVTYSVWDLNRLYRFTTSGHGREEISIDLTNEFGKPMLALPAHLPGAGYESYLVIVPGSQLAAIYDRWGARLLEQNVRVFLQARGNVNKGIRNTIENDPEMFFAYNNGITATAEEVKTQLSNGNLLITGFKNLQIVNGGQTTASIHASSKKKDVDLSKVFVQMKLSIIEPDRTEEVVPKISEYANSQNRINAADFFANHPFHIRMADFSQRIFAPSPDGNFRESKWFYERARGQYQDARTNLTIAQKKKFDLEYPKCQVITKTDFAKYQNTWNGHPNIVSKGAQKNFVHFANFIGKEWSRQPDNFNELYFRHAIVKAIIFRKMEKLVTEQSWYEGGYRANIVAYTIAKFALYMEIDKKNFDFDAVWRIQSINENLRKILTIIATEVHKIIVDPPSGMHNITEWAKTEACWDRVIHLDINISDGLLDSLTIGENQKDVRKAARKDQKILNSIEAQSAVINAGAEFWLRVKDWGTSRQLLNQKETEILCVASSIPYKVPSDKQSIKIMDILDKLRNEGCVLSVDSH